MNQYFDNNRDLSQEDIVIDYRFKGRDFRFVSRAGVFSKSHVDFATDILLNHVSDFVESGVAAGDNIVCGGTPSLLDLGCGYGCIGIVLSKTYSLSLTQCDVNKSALELTRRNCERNGVKSRIVESDCFANIPDSFDLIVVNPPIHAGKSVTYRMYEESREHLNPDGCLYVVTLKKHGAESTVAKLSQVYGGDNCEVVYKKKGIYVIRACL